MSMATGEPETLRARVSRQQSRRTDNEWWLRGPTSLARATWTTMRTAWDAHGALRPVPDANALCRSNR